MTSFTKTTPNTVPDPTVNALRVELGWNYSADNTNEPYVCDLFAVIVDSSTDDVTDAGNFVFYNNLASSDASIFHSGDGNADDLAGKFSKHAEVLTMELADVLGTTSDRIYIGVAIYDSATHTHSFSDFGAAYVKMYHNRTNLEVSSTAHDLVVDNASHRGVLLYRLDRNIDGNPASDWTVTKLGTSLDAFIGDGITDTLITNIAADYGVTES